MENMKIVNGVEIHTSTRFIYEANGIEVEAGTNGYQGGDSGHGSRTYFRISNVSGTDIHGNLLGEHGDDGFEVLLGGDCELSTMIDALKFIVQILEDQTHDGMDKR